MQAAAVGGDGCSRVCVEFAGGMKLKLSARLVTIGSFTHTDGAGPNSFHFTGRVNGRRLKPGL